jgi:hypothetical protein
MIVFQNWNVPVAPSLFGAAIGLTGCFEEPGPLLSSTDGTSIGSGTTGTDGTGGPGDTGSADGTTGLGETGGEGGVVPGDAYAPQIARPSAGQTITPTRAFLLWTDGTIPAGHTVMGYEVCWTTGGDDLIDGTDECPNAVQVEKSRHVLDPLISGTTYAYKVGALYEEGFYSEYSAVLSFETGDSPLGWWRLDGDAADASGVGNHGILQNGAGFGAGINGQALACDGLDDYVNLGSDPSLDVPGPLTLSAWVDGDGLPSSVDSGIVNKGTLLYALTYNTDGEVWSYIGEGPNSLHAPLAPGAWHHVVGTFDGTTAADGMKLYLDGALVANRASTLETTGATGSLWIGRYDFHYFKGLIDDVSVHAADLPLASVVNEYCAVQTLSGTNSLPQVCNP